MERKGGGTLITGGSGYLGMGLAKGLLAEGNTPRAARICIYSRNEHTQARMFNELGRPAQLRMFIGDVRDRERLYWAMKSVDTVIHAAALKRIEVGHYNPGEMVKTNVLGTMNVIDCAIAAGVRRVVMVSTDKAFAPVSPYGISKAMAEAITLASNDTVAEGGPRFSVCRYGNVAGSTGSVIPIWREALARGELINVTDPMATRFWMTREEAVQLVLQAAEGDARLYVPDLPAYTLGSLARALGAVEWNRTHLEHWEKKHETMIEGRSSDTARRMTIPELVEALRHV